MEKQASRIAREILSSPIYLNNYERKFLANVPRCIRKFGKLTAKQQGKLQDLAKRCNVSLTNRPRLSKSAITKTQFADLKRIATKLTNTEKTFLRVQLREERKKNPLDRNGIHKLHRKYFLA